MDLVRSKQLADLVFLMAILDSAITETLTNLVLV
jgi:hypothetical protein